MEKPVRSPETYGHELTRKIGPPVSAKGMTKHGMIYMKMARPRIPQGLKKQVIGPTSERSVDDDEVTFQNHIVQQHKTPQS
jgi:hypothetical protein